MFSRLTILLMLLFSSVRLTTAAPSLQLVYMHGDSTSGICQTLSLFSLDTNTTQDFNLPSYAACNLIWSPDGKYIVTSDPNLMIMDMQQGDVKTFIADGQAGIALWSQHSTYLVWNIHRGSTYTATWGVMNMAAGTIKEYDSFSQIKIEPEEVHYWNTVDDHLFLFRSGHQPQELHHAGSQLNCGWPAWTRWNTAQLLCLDVDLKTYEDDISHLDSDTQTIVKLTDTPDLQEYYPEWSPDGTQIAYQVTEISSGKTWLQIMASDGSNVRRLTHPVDDNVTPVSTVWPDSDVMPHWSPDGQYIAFRRQSDYKGLISKIYIIKADGSELHYLGEGAYPAWRPIPKP